MLQAFLVILMAVSHVHALEMSKRDFCLSQEEARNYQSPQKFKVIGKVSHPALVSTVARLIDEFEVTGPLIFHFTDYVGPKKVWSLQLSDGKHVYFAKNAVDLLLGIELENISAEVCRPEWTGRKTFTVTYTNTVMEQFLRHAATKDSLVKVLMKRTGWKLRSSPNDKHYDEEQEFRTEELVTLIKQLMDIPADVFKKMKIKKITRWRYGAPLPIPGAKAMYYVHEQKIIFGDAALMDNSSDIYGEGTILHEMGHAFWYGIQEGTREKFTRLSWIKVNDKKWERSSDNSNGFVTEYAMTSPEEDFAEHFSAYMHQPELLKRRAAIKNKFFEDEVFTDASFFSTVPENAKVRIVSPTPDTMDPWLERELQFSFEAKATPSPDGSKFTDIEVTVDSARDDLSGIAETLQTFKHKENPEYKVFVTLMPEQMADGSFRLKGSVRTDPNKFAPGNYRPETFSLNDMAGNTKYYDTKSLPELYIDGNLSLTETIPVPLNPELIKIEPAPVINGYHGVITTLPIIYQENFDSIHLNWEVSDLEGKTAHVCSPDKKRNGFVPCLLTGKLGEPLKIQSYFHKEYPRSRIKLASLYLDYKGTTTAAKSSQNHIIPASQENASFILDSGTTSLNLIDMEVNQMKLKALTEPNKAGGDQSIEVTIPLVNSEAGKFSIMAKVRSPGGKGIFKSFSTMLKGEYELISSGEMKILRFKIPLKKNPEDGEYILESFEVKTEYERPRDPYLPLDHNNISVRKIKLLERGIRRTFTISDDKIINLN